MRLYGERDGGEQEQKFQSTHPLRGATGIAADETNRIENFNPRTPCGVRQYLIDDPIKWVEDFNPRTPCGVRRNPKGNSTAGIYFNPRTPCGVRPERQLHAEGGMDFNPRTPCGVRLHFGSLGGEAG